MNAECFVIMTFAQPGSPERQAADLHFDMVRQAAAAAGMVAVRMDYLDTEELRTMMWKKLRSARVAVADLTHPSPNVCYELGVRHGLQMPVVIVTSNIDTLPFDVRDYSAYRFRYDGTDVRELAKRLRNPTREIQSAAFKDWSVRVVPRPDASGHINATFYDTFIDALRRARREVLIVGSGFDDDSPMAEPYLRVLTDVALRVPLVRVEMASATDPHKLAWWQLVATYLLPMTNLELYAPVDASVILLKDIGLIDWDDDDHAVVELMFHATMHSGLTERERAGFALFARSPQLAHDLARVIFDLKQRGHLRRLSTPTDVYEYLGNPSGWQIVEPSGKEVLYFAYGSNLFELQLRQRVGEFQVIGTAMLPDYKLTFSVQGTIFAGGVANIEPCTDESVYGVVYAISEEALERLDFFEGVKQSEYRRTEIRVLLHRNGEAKMVKVWTYLSDGGGESEPSAVYLERIIAGAKSHGLPDAYLRRLQTLRSAEAT